jgi:hypothetical protein
MFLYAGQGAAITLLVGLGDIEDHSHHKVRLVGLISRLPDSLTFAIRAIVLWYPYVMAFFPLPNLATLPNPLSETTHNRHVRALTYQQQRVDTAQRPPFARRHRAYLLDYGLTFLVGHCRDLLDQRAEPLAPLLRPGLCREISARNQEARINNPQASKRRYDDKTLREKFSAALGENPGATPGQIANAIGYKDGKSLIDRCPDLYSVLVERRRANRKQRNESLENALKAALLEQPPPTIKAIATQMGLKTSCAIHYNFPELERAITDKARAYREECLKRALLDLESALTEVPPPSVPEVARNTNHGVAKLYSHFPALCHQVATNYSEYRHQRSIVRKEEKRKSKMNRMS